MASFKHTRIQAAFALPHPGRRLWLLAIGLSLVLFISLLPSIVAKLSALTYPTFTLVVQDVDGNLITDYQFIINVDNTGNPYDDPADCDPANPGYPGTCDWPSIRKTPSNSPVQAIGDSTTPMPITVEPGRYLISVLAPGYKLGGIHVTLDPLADETLNVELVQLQTDPLPLASIRVQVFHDNNVLDSAPDIPIEGPPCTVPLQIDANGLYCPNPDDAFHIIADDPIGENTVDWFGNPLCTEYQRDVNGDIVFDIEGLPIPVPDTGGICLTDQYGYATIPNLGPGKYAVQAIPPDGLGWIQTSTIEGKNEVDAWIQEGSDGYLPPGEGFQLPSAWFGFVRECSFGDAGDDCPTNDVAGSATITGRVRNAVQFIPPTTPIVLDEPVDRPWIGLTNLSGNDEQVYTQRGNRDGTFSIPNVPDGTYQLVVWDEPLDYIISFQTVVVANGQSVDMGDIGVPRWFGWLQGTVFLDDGLDADGNPIPGGAAGNGIRDCANPNDDATCERPLPGVDLDTRFPDGSLQYASASDNRRGLEGTYSFDEVFPFGKFMIMEVAFGRFSRTGETAIQDYGTPAQGERQDFTLDDAGGGLLLNELTVAGLKSYVEWGKQKYAPGENGGIAGIVEYGTTRNEFDPRLAAAEDYEPGIPDVTVNLYAPVSCGTTPGADCDPTGRFELAADGSYQLGALLNSAETDSWYANPPTGCDVLDGNGNPLPDPLGMGPNCIESVSLANEVKPGVFDGGWAFESMCLDFPTCLSEISPLPPGDYIVEVVPPADGDGNPLYEVVKEEDQNTDQGDQFIPLVPPSPCVGPLHLVEDPRNPADGQMTPLCNRRLATLRDEQDVAAGVDFFLFTQVPIPGRIWGLMTDDLAVETDPNRIFYGEKRGIPNTPVGVRDYTGRLITTVSTDDNGVFEVLLPSTYTASCPTPGGVCPGMYLLVNNDPGDPDNPNPNFNPMYNTLTLAFDVWPGKTTYADVALFPSASFGFCELPDTTPQLFTVSQPWVSAASPSFTITGNNFGAAPGSIRLGTATVPAAFITSWTNEQIVVDLTGLPAAGFDDNAGAQQMSITTAAGESTRNSLTMHVLGASYNPPIVTVASGASIQAEINSAIPGTLIVVEPGMYFEPLILYRDVKLQGVGPGGDYGFGNFVQGSVLDGRFTRSAEYLAPWQALLGTLTFGGDQNVPQGQMITVLANPGDFGAAFNAQIDGFRIQGARGEVAGGIYVNAYANALEISNDLIVDNGGGFGGAFTLGRPFVGDNNNDNISIHHNRFLRNGGINLAGGMGIYNGADGYEFAYNDVCASYSAEYGGGLSHYGYSPNGSIHHNRVYYNSAFDEGGGIFVGGELPAVQGTLSQGTGPIDIYNNLVFVNLSNDDGGGIRLLDTLTFAVRVFNNIIADNVATDIGGGIALDDAANVRIANNTIARNVTTGTAEDADGNPHAAGLSSGYHSAPFLATLPPTEPTFSDPALVNDIFWENQAYTWDGAQLNLQGFIDLELYAAMGGDQLNPRYSILTVPYGPAATNLVGVDPQFILPYLLELDATDFVGDPTFVTVVLAAIEQPPELLANYHIADTSPAIDAGQAQPALNFDFDDEARPQGNGYDIGADEVVSAPTAQLYFSTAGNNAIPGLDGPFDEANIYAWDGIAGFSRIFDSSAAGLPGNADIDALLVVDADTFYVSFTANNTNLPGMGNAQDEDIVLYDAGVWSMFFDGSDVGLDAGGNAEDVDAFDILADGSVVVSTAGNGNVPGVGAFNDEDLIRCEGIFFGSYTACTWSVYFDGSDVALAAASENVDGASASAGNIYLSTTGNFGVTGLSGQGVDVFACNGPTTGPNTVCSSFSLFFDGSTFGITDNLDAIDLP